MPSGTPGKAKSPNVTHQRGQALRRRIDKLGISARELAAESGVSRGPVSKALAGTGASEGTYERLERFLDDLEERMSLEGEPGDSEDDGTVEFDLTGNFGVHVVVKGSIRNLPELEAAVARLLHEMGEPKPRKA